ncbi:MAG: cation-translocating P-type ATPase [Bacteroidales bacterium]|nr:cation-translocating P-type ATPase [Bacteroidales bacterium]
MTRQFTTLPVEGMTCASCVAAIENSVNKLDGVEKVTANLALGNVSISYDESKVNKQKLIEQIQKAGYRVPSSDTSHSGIKSDVTSSEISLKKLLLTYLLGLPVAAGEMLFHHSALMHYISFGLTALLMAFPARIFFIRAWSQIIHRSPAMDLLVSISTVSAFLLSSWNLFLADTAQSILWFETPAMLLTFIMTGRYLESRAKRKSSEAIRQLQQLQPEIVTVIINGQPVNKPANEVKIHDRVLVNPHEIIPVDGVILKGETHIDESTITGEPLPKVKTKGDQVYSGTRNHEGGITILVTQPPENTLLQGIIRSVAQSLAVKAPSQQLADKISGYFIPVVLMIALITFVIWSFVLHQPDLGLKAAITVLIIACPCALGLATPVALAAAMGKAARHGILFRDGMVMEKLHRVSVAAFDKTGTLTHGRPEVHDFMMINSLSSIEASVFFSMEKSANHPLGEAIAKYLQDTMLTEFYPEVQEKISVIPGRGLQYSDGDNDFFIGSLAGKETLLDSVAKAFVQKHNSEGRTLVCGLKNQQVLWLIALGDSLRDDAIETIRRLKEKGIRCVLLTGDHHEAALKIAAQCGIREVKAGLLPDQKKKTIQELLQKGEKVMMTGDGINDAEALAAAEVSIAMSQGSSIAMDVAGVTLLGGRLLSIVKVIRLSAFTKKIIRENLFWAFFYNILCIPLAAGILYPLTGHLLNPMIAGAAMSLSSLMVVLNSLRITHLKLK